MQSGRTRFGTTQMWCTDFNTTHVKVSARHSEGTAVKHNDGRLRFGTQLLFYVAQFQLLLQCLLPVLWFSLLYDCFLSAMLSPEF